MTESTKSYHRPAKVCPLRLSIQYYLRGLISTNALDEGLRIGGVGRWMNSKVKSVKQGVYRK
jgi:hypothetical protein